MEKALAEMMAQMPIEIPIVIGGKEVKTGNLMDQIRPDDIKGKPLARFHAATPEIVADAITRAVKAQREWAATSWVSRLHSAAADISTSARLSSCGPPIWYAASTDGPLLLPQC